MRKSARKISTSTQRFTEIQEIVDDVVILEGGAACLILETTATNFALQSLDEQQAKIFSYGALLNSLSFPIQILMVSRKLDVSSYIKALESEETKAPNTVLSQHVKLYKEFVQNLVKVNTVLDKKFYVILSYSFLEKGVSATQGKNFVNDAKNILHSKAKSLIQQTNRMGLKSKIMDKESLIKLFHEIYNGHDNHSFSLTENGETQIVGKVQ